MKEDCLTFGDSNNACYDQHAQNEIHCCKNHVMFQVSCSCSPAIHWFNSERFKTVKSTFQLMTYSSQINCGFF